MKIRKLVCGVGINDADYAVERKETIIVNGKRKQKLVWACPFYRAWKNMLARCYSTKYQERCPTYRGCSVSEEWLTTCIRRASGGWEMLRFNKTAKIDKIQVFDGKAEAQNYFNILSSLGIDVESFFIGVNNYYEHVYFIDEALNFDELNSLLKGYRIKMIVERQ